MKIVSSLIMSILAFSPAFAETVSESGMNTLREHEIEVDEVGSLGLTSDDLRELGFGVSDRIALLRASSEKKKSSQDDIALVQEFGFVASYINSTRQYGKCLNGIVKYRYPASILTTNDYLDYREIYERFQWYAQPSKELPQETQWELVNNAFVTEIMESYDIVGMSSQIQVKDSQTEAIYEPGNHGTTVTTGDCEPVSESWVNNFAYDCTTSTGPA